MAREGHVPIRTCVVCGKRGPKFTLVRMALDAIEKSVVLDRNQCLEGRGAYACSGCLPQLRFSRRVQKAFRGRARGLAQESRPSIAQGAD